MSFGGYKPCKVLSDYAEYNKQRIALMNKINEIKKLLDAKKVELDNLNIGMDTKIMNMSNDEAKFCERVCDKRQAGVKRFRMGR